MRDGGGAACPRGWPSTTSSTVTPFPDPAMRKLRKRPSSVKGAERASPTPTAPAPRDVRKLLPEYPSIGSTSPDVAIRKHLPSRCHPVTVGLPPSQSESTPGI